MTTILGQGDVVADRYELGALLGRGGMGYVFEAYDVRIDRQVAVKVLQTRFSCDRSFRRRFEREALVMSKLTHPGVVAVHDFGEDRGALYLVMERLRGSTLSHVLHYAEGGLAFERILEYSLAIADVLVAAHAAALVHRDLKPDNVMVERLDSLKERVVVLDFGLAFLQNHEDLGRVTRTGNISGTPQYLAPEQGLGQELTPAVDVYALGCVMFELCTKRPPFIEQQSFQLLQQHIYGSPPRLGEHTLRDDVPRVFERLVGACLRKSPAERPTAREVLELLEAIAIDPHARARARGLDAVVDRDDRMITIPDNANTIDAIPSPGVEFTVGVIDLELDAEWRHAFATHGLVPQLTTPRQVQAEPLVYGPRLTPDEVKTMVDQGIVVIAGAAPGEMNRITALLRAGVSEIATIPTTSMDAARLIRRASKKLPREESS